MVQQRIGDFKELQNHKVSRQMLRDIRRLRKEGNTKEANNLQKQWRTQYDKR